MDNSESFRGVGVTSKVRVTGSIATLITGHSFAQYWLADALQEGEGKDFNSIRREIVFASSFLESYIFEWAQGQLSNDAEGLLDLFPLHKNLPSLTIKWKQTPQKIYVRKGLGKFPELEFTDFDRLVSLRNNLLHSQASRFLISNEMDLSWPEPSIKLLEAKGNGWATRVAISLVKELHRKCGSEPPKYFLDAVP